MRPEEEDTTWVTSAPFEQVHRSPGFACLVTISGAGLGTKWPLERETTIGRGASCDLSVPVRDISRRHCRILLQGTQLLLEDLGSTNGTC